MSHGALGTGSASQVRLFGFVSGIVVGDLLDLFELLDEAGLSNLHSRLVHSTVKQGYQRQCENAVKRMDAKHLVGPMVGRGKADEVGIFHVSESSLDVMLAAIAKMISSSVRSVRSVNTRVNGSPTSDAGLEVPGIV
jgi:hypothetical protein